MSHVQGATLLAARRLDDVAAEKALLDQCRRQNYEAFGRVVDLYQARVLGFVRRMIRNEEEALDITQEVFIKAFQGVASFDGRASLRSWLFRIAYHSCIDKVRRKERQPLIHSYEPTDENEETFEFADHRWDPSEVLLNDELRSVVEQSVAEMSEKLRSVLILHDQENMGYEEIAQAMDIPVGTVKSRLFLARAHLQEQVGRYLYGKGA
ncbi:MAG: sigma-70 family RNA polymerase sigma factor [Armatimonadetes bacterium]|nr:sigma-70 family RNA polymerase sigma factor [Armatimonadota bacterium]